MILPLTYSFQADDVIFLLERVSVELVHSAEQINVVVTFTADCTCNHLTKNVYIFERNVKFKTN